MSDIARYMWASIECSPWRHCLDWLTEKPPLSPCTDLSKALFLHLGHVVTRACIFVVNQNTRNILGSIKRGHIFLLPDHITRMKIFWQIKKKWQVILKITTKTYIYATAITTGSANHRPIPDTLCIRLSSHFGDSKIPIDNENRSINQQLFRLINRLFPIIGTSLQKYNTDPLGH